MMRPYSSPQQPLSESTKSVRLVIYSSPSVPPNRTNRDIRAPAGDAITDENRRGVTDRSLDIEDEVIDARCSDTLGNGVYGNGL